MRPRPIAPAVVALLALGAGCDLTRFTASRTAMILERAAPALEREPDVQLAREAAPGQLKTVEGFLLADPGNRRLLGILARGTCEYAFGFLESDVEALALEGKDEEAAALARRATGLFGRCQDYALELLGPAWRRDFQGDFAALERRVARARRSDVPGMFFAALGLASAIDLNRDDIEIFAELPRARLLFERVVKLDPGFYHGGALMALGKLECVAGGLGGSVATGRGHFERAAALAGPGFFMPRVLMARFCGTAANDREFFHRTLVEVVETSTAIAPENRLANELAHLRAKRYLAHEKEWFDAEEERPVVAP